MKVQLDKTYPMPCDADVAWAFLRDIQSVATCMPGATITERVDDNRYKGTVTVKMGPATMTFRGEIAMSDVDPATRSLRLSGKGTDSSGSSGASMNLAARIEPAPEPGHCTLAGMSEVSMSGKAASFGARLMNPIAEQIVKQFADNFATRVGLLQAQRAAPQAVDGAPVVDVATPEPSAKPLNGLALAWSLLRSWLRSLFGKKAT